MNADDAASSPGTAPAEFPGPPQMRAFTGYLLRRAHVASVAALDRSMQQDRRPRELAVLLLLAARGPLSQHELGAEWAINRTSMVKLIDHLEASDLLRRERNPVDRRSYALRLTAEGRAATTSMLDRVDAAEAELTAAMTASEVGRLNELLARLAPPAPEGAFELATRTPFLLARAHRVVREWGDEALEPVGLKPRHAASLSVLAGLAPCSQQRLAEGMRISAPSALDIVTDLLELGLVERERDSSDRRAYLLRVTAAGRQRVQEAGAAMRSTQQAVVKLLGAEGDAQLRALLTKILSVPAGAPGVSVTQAGSPPTMTSPDRPDRPASPLDAPEGVNAASQDAVEDAGAPTGPGDVRAGGRADHARDQQSAESFPSPLGGSPWQDPTSPDEKEYSGDR